MIYLDNAATTMKKPKEVSETVLASFDMMGNAGRGAHGGALAMARMIYDARVSLAELFGSSYPEQIAFSANATAALNLAINGLIGAGDHVITTDCEHNSVLRPLYRKEEAGTSLSFLPVDKEGVLRYELLPELVRPNTKAFIVTHASNVTGNVTNLELCASFAKEHGLLLIVDASQTAGHLPIDVERLGIDVLCFTGHKGLFGPQGTGGLYVRKGLTIPPMCVGGSGVKSYLKTHPADMPTALEAGTLNGHGIAGLCAGARFLQKVGIDTIRAHEIALLHRLEEGLRAIPGITVYGAHDPEKRTGIVSVNLADEDSGQVSDWLWEEYSIATRPGAHCAPRMHEALGTKEQGAVRFSLSYFNTESEIDAAINAMRELASWLRPERK